jgi:lysophospholipase L1-like esterase
MNRFRIPAGKIFLLFFGFFFAFIILEVSLRIYNPFGFRIKNDRIVLPANKVYRFQNKKLEKFDKEILIRKNSIGFRGEEPPKGKSFEDFLTFITIGGSTTECSLTSEGKTWTDLLGKDLKASFKKVWINNAGLDGHSTFGHIILMEDYIIRLKPKVLLFLVGVNDTGPRQSVDEMEHLHIKSKIDFMDPKRIFKRLLAHSEVFNVLGNLYRYYRDRITPRHLRPIVEVGYSKYEKPISEWDKLEISNNEWNLIVRNHERWMERFRVRLNKIVRLSRANGIEPIFITQPGLFGDCNDEDTGVYLGNIKVYSGMNGKTWWNLLELYNDVTRQVGKEDSVFVIDLAKRMKKNSLFFTDAVHFTNAGQENLADILYRELCPFLSRRYPEYSRGKCPD